MSNEVTKRISNNPSGRAPVARALREMFRDYRERTIYAILKIGDFNEEETLRLTAGSSKNVDSMIANYWIYARKGDIAHSKELLDRILGPVTQTILLGEATDDGLKNISADHILTMINALKKEEGTEPCKLIPQP